MDNRAKRVIFTMHIFRRFTLALFVTVLHVGCEYNRGKPVIHNSIWHDIEIEALDDIRTYAASKKNMNVSRRSDPESNLLIHAINNDAYESFTLLLELGADPNAETRSGQTAMHISTLQKDTKWLQALVDHGGDVNLWNNTVKGSRGTPLKYAACAQHPESGSTDNPFALGMVELLVANGADVNKRSGEYLDNEYPIVAAGNGNRFDIVLHLLQHGADYGNCGPPPSGLLEHMRDVHTGSFPEKSRREDYLKVVEWIEQDAKSQGDEETIELLHQRSKEVAEFKKRHQ